MYRIVTSNKRVKKRLRFYMESRGDVVGKLGRIRCEPRRECGAHLLKGRLKGKWSCWLGSNIRVIYTIDDFNKIIWIESVGSHKVY